MHTGNGFRRETLKPGFVRYIMAAIFGLSRVAPGGTVNLGMTLYLDLGSKGITILAYPWFIRVIDTNKFPYI